MTSNSEERTFDRPAPSTSDKVLGKLGLVRRSRMTREVEAIKEQRNAAKKELGRMRYGYGRIMQAIGMHSGRPNEIEAPDREEVRAAAKALARVVGGRSLARPHGNYEPVLVTLLDTVRASVAAGMARESRGFALEVGDSGEMLGRFGAGIAYLRLELWAEAYRELSAFGRQAALEFVPDEYLQAAAKEDPLEAVAAARELIDGGGTLAAHTLDATRWVRLAERLVMLKEPALVASALSLAEAAGAEGLEPQIDFVRSWLEIEAKEPAVVSDAISIGIVDYKQPLFEKSSTNLGDHVQTLASMGHLVRHQNITFTGEPELVDLAETLAARVKPERQVLDSATTKVNLSLVQRDASDLQLLPEQTWMVTFGWYAHNRPDNTYGMPLNPNVRPIFVSVHINKIEMLTPDAIAYLRKYAPVGCRDWHTVHLLHAAGIPAFFSGCITTTVDTVFPGPVGPRGHGDLFVDARQTGPGTFWRQVRPEVRTDPFVVNMHNALAKLTEYRDYYDHVYTSRLHCFLPARSIGADVTFIAKKESDPRFDGLIGIDDAAFEKIRQGILGKVQSVMTLILAGTDEAEVYRTWAELCADDVAYAQQVRDEINATPLPQAIDVKSAVESARALAKHFPATQPGVGEEVHVELSLDGNFKTQMYVMVESVLENTSRPIHFWVLARDHDEADFELVARLFPRASFTWIPTDSVDYGDIHGMITHTTIATMDRLLLPLLMPDVAKVIHLDLDAIALGDIGELYDTDVADVPLAARTRQDDALQGGFKVLRGNAADLTADLSREFIARTHSRIAYDFHAFNAGIMVLNLERMRADNFVDEFLPYASRYGLHDQDVLNAYAGGTRKVFGAEWNIIARDESIENAKIIHWAGGVKPWSVLPTRGQQLWLDARDRMDERLAADAGGVTAG